jgi:hypothetical protein
MGLMAIESYLVLAAIVVAIILIVVYWGKIKQCDAGNGGILCKVWHYSPFRFFMKLAEKVL